MEERVYYIYRHLRNDTGRPFYIGQGVKPTKYYPSTEYERAHSTTDRGSHWENVVKKCGYTVEIMIDDLREDEVNAKEIEMIALYGRTSNGGILVNKTDGGEGNKGYIPTAETKQKLRDVNLIPLDKNIFDNSFPCPITGCHHWIGGGVMSERKKKAYINVDGKSHPAQKFLYEYYNSIKLTNRQLVFTSCGNRFCVNQDHFYVGTFTDYIKKGTPRAFKHHRQILTEDLVRQIRKLKLEEKLGPTAISKLIGINRNAIGFVLSGKSWGWLK